jgi:hypothetical protein
MVAWDRVTRRDVLRAIHEYDRLGPEQFFSEHGFALPRAMSWSGINAVTRLRQSWVQLMSSSRGTSLALATSRVGGPAP